METAQSEPTMLQNFIRYKLQISIGFILVAVLHTLFNIGLIACMFVLLKKVYPVHAHVYFSCGIISTLLLAAGAVCLMFPVTVSTHSIVLQNTGDTTFTLLVQITAAGRFYLYQSGMAIWGVGGLTLCYILFKTRAVPLVFPLSGFAGYAIFIIGTMLELFGHPVGVILSIPGGLIEIALSIWMIVKGIKTQPKVIFTDR